MDATDLKLSREIIEEEAAALVIQMDEPTPEIVRRVRQFCGQSEVHKATYEAIQRSWDRTSILQINRVLQ